MTEIGDDIRISEVIGDERQFRQFVALRLVALTRDVAAIQTHGCNRFQDHQPGLGYGKAAGVSGVIASVIIALVEWYRKQAG